MNESAGELNLSAVRTKREQPAPAPLREDATFAPRTNSAYLPTGAPTTPVALKSGARLFCDPWRILTALKQRFRLVFGAAIVTAILAGFLGYLQSSYRVRVTLIAREANAAMVTSPDDDRFRPRQIASATLVPLMQSPEVLRRAAAKAQPPGSASPLEGQVSVEPVANTDLVGLQVAGKNRQSLVDLANVLANEAVAFGRELQVAEAEQVNRVCQDKLDLLDAQLRQANAELMHFQDIEKLADPDAEKQGYIQQLSDVMARADNARIAVELLDLQVEALQNELAQQSPIAQKLEAARRKLSNLLEDYTEKHILVQRQRALMTELEKQLPAVGISALTTAKYSDNPQVSGMYVRLVDLQTRRATTKKELSELTKLHDSLLGKVTGLSVKSLRFATLKAKFDGLQQSRGLLAGRQREAQLYQENSQGYYRVLAPATLTDVDAYSRWLAALVAGSMGLFLGGLGAGLVITGQEIADRRLKTAVDVQRATGLPVLASLGDLNQMSAAEKDAWAFRTWTAISGQLNASPNHGIVCGFISSGPGEGRSTWIEFLVSAARQRGLQVMTISTRTGEDSLPETDLPPNVVEPDFYQPAHNSAAGEHGNLASSRTLAVESASGMAAHIPLPGKVWELARRQEWQSTLAQMQQMDNLVLLVELPPASVPEAVLLAESLPQVIWLADSGRASGHHTREQLQTLRHAKCRLVGAVLNHEPKAVFEL